MDTKTIASLGLVPGEVTVIRLVDRPAVDVFALGPELKNTVCVAHADYALVSSPHGDLSEAVAYRGFLRTADRVRGALADRSHVVAHDLHPAYASTLYAAGLPQRKVAVQHHHAHGVSCAVDAGVALPVIAVACDGTGYGSDGAIWGGEVLLCRGGRIRPARPPRLLLATRWRRGRPRDLAFGVVIATGVGSR